MNPAGVILLYSKYSESCQNLFDLVRNSGVDFSFLQSLCVDNDQVRKRVQGGKMDITKVPCLLQIFPNGTVEKYEGNHAVNWFQTTIAKSRPPPPPPPQLPPPPPPRPTPPPPPPVQVEEEYQPELPDPSTYRSDINVGQDIPERKMPPPQQHTSQPKRRGPPPRMKKIAPPPRTPIDQIEEPESEETDRHRSAPPRAMIRRDEGNYEDDQNLFNSEQVDNHHQTGREAVRPDSNNKGIQDQHGTMAKMKNLMQQREEMEAAMKRKQPVPAMMNDRT